MRLKKPPGKIIIYLSLTAALTGAVVLFEFVQRSNREFILSRQAALEHAKGLAASTFGDLVREEWSIFLKLEVEKEFELLAVPISIGTEQKSYYETRIFFSPDGTHSANQKRFSDKERTLGLKLMNTETGQTTVIAVETHITPDGVEVIAPDGYVIGIVERANGIKWNLWNTEYKVLEPKNTVVLENCWPREETVTVSKVVNGRPLKETKKVTVCFPYVPYSDYLRQEEIIESGVDYDKHIIERAFTLLRERGVMSKAFPDTLVVDVQALSPRMFERLPLLEQMDLTEFTVDPQKAAERVLVILGANRENAWIHTCNRVDACGWIQFTPGTYGNIRLANPAAQLFVDFEKGAADHINSMMAAILLHDSNLASLVKRYGEDITNDPHLEEYLAASYNGAPCWVNNSLDATISRGLPDWTKALSSNWRNCDSRGGLRTETQGFMYKLRYLVENELP